MLRYFDKTFFRFLIAFAGILAVSFAVLLIVGYYEVEMKAGGAAVGRAGAMGMERTP